jgi:hypothetical protein
MASVLECIAQIAVFPYWLSRTIGTAPAEKWISGKRRKSERDYRKMPDAGRVRGPCASSMSGRKWPAFANEPGWLSAPGTEAADFDVT